MAQESIFNNTRIGKFVGERSRTIRFSRKKILDDPSMSPTEETVEIAEFLIERVVTCRPDRNDVGSLERNPSNFFGQRMNPCVRSDPLTVLHPEIEELARALTIDKDTRDHQRSEKITLPAFVHAKMRLKHFRRMHLFVAEPSFTENLRFENELYETLHPAPLHQNLWTFLIDGHAQLFLLRKKNRVRLRREGESAFMQKRAQLLRLPAR